MQEDFRAKVTSLITEDKVTTYKHLSGKQSVLCFRETSESKYNLIKILGTNVQILVPHKDSHL
jgi:hypothetical protein